MNKVLSKLPALMAEELQAANEANPPFHSLHEGWAVLHEEVEETREALIKMGLAEKNLWEAIRNNYPASTHYEVLRVMEHAYQTAAEAIQVAAMAQKLIDGIEAGFDAEAATK